MIIYRAFMLAPHALRPQLQWMPGENGSNNLPTDKQSQHVSYDSTYCLKCQKNYEFYSSNWMNTIHF